MQGQQQPCGWLVHAWLAWQETWHDAWWCMHDACTSRACCTLIDIAWPCQVELVTAGTSYALHRDGHGALLWLACACRVMCPCVARAWRCMRTHQPIDACLH